MFVRVVPGFLTWCKERNHVAENVTAGIKAITNGSLPTWATEQADIAERDMPATLSRAAILVRHTELRRSDLVEMRWPQISETHIHVKIIKGKRKPKPVEVDIPSHSVLIITYWHGVLKDRVKVTSRWTGMATLARR